MRSLRLLAATTLAALLVACGSAADDDGTDATDTTTDTADTTPTDDGADDADADDDADGTDGTDGTAAGDAFPVTIEHAYGETVIEERPERIATVAWANHEVPLALGVVPVGMAAVSWGDDDGDGVMPWVEARLEELGAGTPALFDETDGVDVEAVAATEPDVILATYSGISAEEYDLLSRIAPVVAYPEIAWATSVQDMVRISSRAIGLEAEGEALVEDLDAQVASTFAEHPELDDASVMFAYLDPNDLSTIGFYTTHDTRPAFLADAGIEVPSLVEERSAGTEAFYETISAEEGDRLDDVDVLITYGAPDGSTLELLRSDPLLSRIPAIERGSVVILEDSTPLAAAANPSPLSIGWTLDEYAGLLAEAAEAAAAAR